MGVKIVKHQTFEVIHVFENEPETNEVFDDNSTIELLLRNT